MAFALKYLALLQFLVQMVKSELILVAGGFSAGTVIDNVEILSLDSMSDISCDIDSFPAQLEGGVASNIEGKVVVCGGKDKDGGIRRDCAELSPNGTWNNAFAVMGNSRLFPFGVNLGNEWIITGGTDQDGVLTKSSEIYKVLGFKPGPILPVAVNDHCIARINSTHFALIGGKTEKTSFSPDSFLYSSIEDKWTELPNLNVGRNGHFCGLVEGQENIIFVAAGYEGGWVETDSVETLDISKVGAWKPEDFKFPAKIAYGVTVEGTEGQTYMVGGTGSGGTKEVATIYALNYDKKEFELLNARLKVPRSGFMAVAIPDEFLTCSN